MDIVQICEVGMLVAFGLSWPFNIAKSWKSRTAKGKSVVFEFAIIIGYLFGITGKFITYSQTGVLTPVLWVYFLDVLMVSIDVCLYFRNAALDKKRENEK